MYKIIYLFKFEFSKKNVLLISDLLVLLFIEHFTIYNKLLNTSDFGLFVHFYT